MSEELPMYTSVSAAEARGLVTLTTMAERLGRKRGTVHMWAKRRRTTNFPLPKACYKVGSRIFWLWDMTEVSSWHKSYVPNPGGAPLGNRNWVPKRDKALTPSVD